MASVWVASACELDSTIGSASCHNGITNAQAIMRQLVCMVQKADHCALVPLIVFMHAYTVCQGHNLVACLTVQVHHMT